MATNLTFIYDDRLPVSPEIEAIIGAKNYSTIVRRRERFGAIIYDAIKKGGCRNFIHLLDDADARHLANLIRENPSEKIFFRYPSCYMPSKPELFTQFIAQCEFALHPVLVTSIANGEAPSLFDASAVLPLLRSYDSESASDYLLKKKNEGSVVSRELGLVNISQANQFLQYMWDATETRSFNSTYGDQRTLRKSSQDKRKIYREYRFFHVVPEALKQFLVPTFDYAEDSAEAAYSMERLAIPDVALQTIHNAFDKNSFASLVSRFFDFIDARPRDICGEKKARDVALEAILGKMNKRLSDFMASSIGKEIDAILCSAGPAGSLNEMADKARFIIRRAIDHDKTDHLAISHGDPCFSNILFDRRTAIMRLIDPRGAVELEEAWMHPLYDVAKFSHSILGGYDYVNNDLFECKIGANLKLELEFYFDEQKNSLKNIFTDELEHRHLDLSIIRAYELSLFMSMLPLHSDHPRKLIGYALIASDLLNKLEQE